MTDTLNGIFEEWKKIGYGPKKENDKIWQEFRAALNSFYGKKREFFNEIKKTHKENKEKKTAIIEKAEAIANSEHENWDDTTKEILNLQKDWKNAGHVEPWEENKLWKKFRDACDKFFNAKRDQYKSRDSEQLVNLEKKQELIKRVKHLNFRGKLMKTSKLCVHFLMSGKLYHMFLSKKNKKSGSNLKRFWIPSMTA